ncbi:MAG: Hsp20/alpha crystallin family protein, partial [Acidobacteria bacterium]|nr:Hsp20/alpha crystallin family protein [Acidobacteriota bacterium]
SEKMRNVGRVIGLERIEIERLRNRVGRLLAALQEVADDGSFAVPGGWSPPVDLCETEGEVCLSVELPGVPAESIEISLTSNYLRISGKKKRRVLRGSISHLCSERSYGNFNRTVPLRWPVHVRGATAELNNGLLRIRLPKLADRRGAEFKVQIKEKDEG